MTVATPGLEAWSDAQEAEARAMQHAHAIAHPLTARQIAEQQVSFYRNQANNAGRDLLHKRYRLANAQREEANDIARGFPSFAPGRGPVFEATRALRTALAMLDETEAKLVAAEAVLAGMDMRRAA